MVVGDICTYIMKRGKVSLLTTPFFLHLNPFSIFLMSLEIVVYKYYIHFQMLTNRYHLKKSKNKKKTDIITY